MRKLNEDNLCIDLNCENFGKQHFHVSTPNGGYVRFIVEKPTVNIVKDYKFDSSLMEE